MHLSAADSLLNDIGSNYEWHAVHRKQYEIYVYSQPIHHKNTPNARQRAWGHDNHSLRQPHGCSRKEGKGKGKGEKQRQERKKKEREREREREREGWGVEVEALMASKMQWEDVQKELQGRTQFAEPVVTQEVLLEALRSSAFTLSVLKVEYSKTVAEVNSLKNDNAMLKNAVQELRDRCDNLGNAVQGLNKKMDKAEDALEKMGDPEVIGSLPKRMIAIEEHYGWISRLSELFGRMDDMEMWKMQWMETWQKHTEEFQAVQAWKQQATERIDILEEKAASTVDAEQLQKALDEVNASIAAQGDVVGNLDAKVQEQGNTLEKKADLEAFEKVRALVEEHEEGMGETLQVAKTLNSRMTGQEGQLLDVRDRMDGIDQALAAERERIDAVFDGEGGVGGGLSEEEVDQKIDARYTVIVEQLEEAIRSATEDEDEFRRIANDLQMMMKKMQIGKADNREVAELKERVMVDSRMREQVDHLKSLTDMKISRDEARALVRKNATKAELQQALKKLKTQVGEDVDLRLDEYQDSVAGPALATSMKEIPRGSKSLLCLTCNRQLDRSRQENDANRSVKANGRKSQQHAVQGPGGTSLGGGFQVRIPERNPAMNHLPPEYQLPSIDPRLRKPAGFVLGSDGRVYPGRSTPNLHTWGREDKQQQPTTPKGWGRSTPPSNSKVSNR